MYAFGVLLLQIISGKRNACVYGLDKTSSLLDFVSFIDYIHIFTNIMVNEYILLIALQGSLYFMIFRHMTYGQKAKAWNLWIPHWMTELQPANS